MPIPKETVSFSLGAVAARDSSRHMFPGELTEARNVYIPRGEPRYRKRPSIDRFAPAVDSGSFTTGATSLTYDGYAVLARDGADVTWAASSGSAPWDWRNRGTQRRALWYADSAQVLPSATKTNILFVGSRLWVFSLGAANTYQIHVVDPSTRTIVVSPVAVTATGITTYGVVSNGTDVWVLWAAGTNVVNYHRFNGPTPTSTPSATGTYQTLTAGGVITGIDAHRFTAGSLVALHGVAVTMYRFTGAFYEGSLTVSYLDTTTNLPAAAVPPVTTTVNTGALAAGVGPLPPSIVNSDGTSGNWYVLCWWDGWGAGQANLRLFTVTGGTLATATTATLRTETSANNTPPFAMAVGYVDPSASSTVVAYSAHYNPAGGLITTPWPFVLQKHVWSGALTTTTVRRYSHPVSKPAKLSSGRWALWTGYDDGTARALERSYFLIDQDGGVISQAGYGQAAMAGLRSTITAFAATMAGSTNMVVSGSSSYAGVLLDIGGGANNASGGLTVVTGSYAPTVLTATVPSVLTCQAPAKFRDGQIVNGNGTPFRTSSVDLTRELALMLSPPPVTAALGGGAPLAGATTVQVCYRWVDQDGTITRSSPSAAQQFTFTNAGTRSVTIRSLTHYMGTGTPQIELYLSVVGQTTPYLYTVVNNDASVDTQTITIDPANVPANEIIYTLGGGLSNAPLPSARATCMWRNRVFLAAGNWIWFSQELTPGFGPQFNEVLRAQWTDGDGEILAILPIDRTSLAVFKRNRIGIITGRGPDGRGQNGVFEVETLEEKIGLDHAMCLATGPGGVYYLGTNERFYCLTPSLTSEDISRGLVDNSSRAIVAAAHVEHERHMWFFNSDGSISVLDYGNPTEKHPFGRWYTWSSTALSTWVRGVTVVPDGVNHWVYFLDPDGVVRSYTGNIGASDVRDTTSGSPAEVRMKVTTGDLAAAGELQGEFRLDALTLLGEFLSTHTFTVTVSGDFGNITDTSDPKVASASPWQWFFRPAGMDRIQSVQVTIEETASVGAGFILDGCALRIQVRGRSKMINTAQWLT